MNLKDVKLGEHYIDSKFGEVQVIGHHHADGACLIVEFIEDGDLSGKYEISEASRLSPKVEMTRDKLHSIIRAIEHSAAVLRKAGELHSTLDDPYGGLFDLDDACILQDDALPWLRSILGQPESMVVPLDRDPLEAPLPCDIKLGHITLRKGVHLRSLVETARRWMPDDMKAAADRDPLGLQPTREAVFLANLVGDLPSSQYEKLVRQNRPLCDWWTQTGYEIAKRTDEFAALKPSEEPTQAAAELRAKPRRVVFETNPDFVHSDSISLEGPSMVSYCPNCSHISSALGAGPCCPDRKPEVVSAQTAAQAKAGYKALYLDEKTERIFPDGPWIGCRECDESFACHDGKARCIRRLKVSEPDAAMNEASVKNFTKFHVTPEDLIAALKGSGAFYSAGDRVEPTFVGGTDYTPYLRDAAAILSARLTGAR